jgi:hypothetical protein
VARPFQSNEFCSAALSGPRLNRLRHGYGRPPKLRAKAEAPRYEDLNDEDLNDEDPKPTRIRKPR